MDLSNLKPAAGATKKGRELAEVKDLDEVAQQQKVIKDKSPEQVLQYLYGLKVGKCHLFDEFQSSVLRIGIESSTSRLTY